VKKRRWPWLGLPVMLYWWLRGAHARKWEDRALEHDDDFVRGQKDADEDEIRRIEGDAGT
jgi:hypothetical protein